MLSDSQLSVVFGWRGRHARSVPTRFDGRQNDARFDDCVVTLSFVWSYVADADSIPDGEAIRFLPEKSPPLAIFNSDGEFFCTTDTCTHETSSLSDGYIEGDTVECPFHFAKFSLRTGAVLCAPAMLPIKTFPVKVEDGKIFVDL